MTTTFTAYGPISNSDQRSNAISANNSAMSSASSAMNAQSAGNSLCDSLNQSINDQISSLSADPFQLNKDRRIISLKGSAAQVNGWKHQTLQAANSLSMVYDQLNEQSRNLNNIGGSNLGAQLAKQSHASDVSDAARSLKLRKAYDQPFSLSYSASQSASASIAALPQSTKDSLLRSIAASKRNGN